MPERVRLLPSYRDWERWGLSPSASTFQREGSQVLEKGIPGHTTFKTLFKRFTSQSVREKLHSKVNALEIGRSEA